MTETLFDLDSVPLACPSCGSVLDDETQAIYAVGHRQIECSDCYVNEHCPDGCNVPHPPPMPRGWRRRVRYRNEPGTWECPTTGAEFRYLGPNERPAFDPAHARCGNWEPNPYGDSSFLYNDVWYENAGDAGFYWCERCDEYFDPDSSAWADGRNGYCRDCSFDDDDYYDEEDYGSSGSETRPVCFGCARVTTLTHYHVITENAYCADCVDNETGPNVALIPEAVAA